MKRCTYCITLKFDEDFAITKRIRVTERLDEGITKTGKVSYSQSWCRECTKRQLRINRGTETFLDSLWELSIKIKKDNR